MTDWIIPVSPLPIESYGAYAPSVSTIGKNLVRIREEELKITQEEVVARCGVSQNNLSKWETGKSEPKVASLLKLAVGLNLPITTLIAGVNRDFDLACQKRDQQLGLSRTGGPHDATAAGLERERHIANFSKKAREVLKLSDKLHEAAIDLEEIRKAAEGEASRGSGHRKTG